MHIVTGSGRNRKVLEFPCAAIVKSSPEDQQKQGKELLCSMLNIPSDLPVKDDVKEAA